METLCIIYPVALVAVCYFFRNAGNRKPLRKYARLNYAGDYFRHLVFNLLYLRVKLSRLFTF